MITSELFPIEVQPNSDKIVGRRLCFILNAKLKVTPKTTQTYAQTSSNGSAV